MRIQKHIFFILAVSILMACSHEKCDLSTISLIKKWEVVNTELIDSTNTYRKIVESNGEDFDMFLYDFNKGFLGVQYDFKNNGKVEISVPNSSDDEEINYTFNPQDGELNFGNGKWKMKVESCNEIVLTTQLVNGKAQFKLNLKSTTDNKD